MVKDIVNPDVLAVIALGIGFVASIVQGQNDLAMCIGTGLLGFVGRAALSRPE